MQIKTLYQGLGFQFLNFYFRFLVGKTIKDPSEPYKIIEFEKVIPNSLMFAFRLFLTKKFRISFIFSFLTFEQMREKNSEFVEIYCGEEDEMVRIKRVYLKCLNYFGTPIQ